MSIYIKGMELPKEKIVCLLVSPDGQAFVKSESGQEEKYQLMPVSEHGELIDRDELKTKEWVIDEIVHYYNAEDIRNAPTIIPSDKKDSTTYNIDWHYIDDDGYIRTKTLDKFDNLDSAMTAYRKYVRSCAPGWYNLIQYDQTAAKEKTE